MPPGEEFEVNEALFKKIVKAIKSVNEDNEE